MKLIINNVKTEKVGAYLVQRLVCPFGDTEYIKMYSPSIYTERIEDKLKIEIKLNVIRGSLFPEGFLYMDVELPTQKITSVVLSEDWNSDEDKVQIPESRHTPYIFKGTFTIDLNADQYFDREITQEMVPMKLTFREEPSWWPSITVNSEKVKNDFRKELYEQEVNTSFLYWNTITYDGNELKIPMKEKFQNNELVWSNNYSLNISLNDFDSSIISYLLKVNNENQDNYFLYSRGYNLKFSDIRTGKEILSTKSNLNKKVEKYLTFDTNYDFDIEGNTFIETSSLNGINMFNTDSFSLSGCILLKLNNTNFRVKINKNFYNNNYQNFNVRSKIIDADNEKEFIFNEI